MFRIFVVNETRPFETLVAKTLTSARRIAKEESIRFAPELVKIIDLHANNAQPDEYWQKGKKAE